MLSDGVMDRRDLLLQSGVLLSEATMTGNLLSFG